MTKKELKNQTEDSREENKAKKCQTDKGNVRKGQC